MRKTVALDWRALDHGHRVAGWLVYTYVRYIEDDVEILDWEWHPTDPFDTYDDALAYAVRNLGKDPWVVLPISRDAHAALSEEELDERLGDDDDQTGGYLTGARDTGVLGPEDD